jgi:hypothetical protein
MLVAAMPQHLLANEVETDGLFRSIGLVGERLSH